MPVGTAHAETSVVSVDASDSPDSLRAKIPVSGSFTLEYAFDSEVEEGSVVVWPERVQDCTAQPPALGSAQTYYLKFVVTTEEGKTKGKTTVPHLQVGEHFCLQVSSVKKVSPDQVVLDATIAAKADVVSTFADARTLANDLLKATAAGFCALPSQPQGAATCSDVDLNPLIYPLLDAVLKAHTDKVQAEETDKERTSAQDDLLKHVALAKQFNPPNELKDKVPSGSWTQPGTHDDVKRAQEVVTANAKTLGQSAGTMTNWLVELDLKLTKFERLDAAAREAKAEAALSRTAGLAKQRDVAYEFFKNKLRARTRATQKVRGATSDFNNYLSPEIGMALALPLMGDARITLVPYTAVNIYLSPVDRELALGEVVNSFRQRFSLTLGLTLSEELKADQVDFSPTVAGTFGVAGAGYRVLPFARIAGLILFAKASPSGGLSTQSKLITAGAVAVSADVDVITFIGNSLTKK
jgi:hypothetical protein